MGGRSAAKPARPRSSRPAAPPPATATFVNPYTFVPFPELERPEGFRYAPAKHHALGQDRYLGTVEVTLTARSPLLVRGVTREQAETFPRRRFPGSTEEVPYLPGSSLAGVVRSLHETIAGGCLRVFDDTYLPVYRDQVSVRPRDWTLARVEESRDGRPTRFAICTEVVRVGVHALHEKLGGPDAVISGTRVDLVEEHIEDGVPDGVVKTPAGVERGDGWVLLVTDAAVRDRGKPYYCTAGRLPDGPADMVDGFADEEDEVWKRYKQAVDGTDDMRRARGGKDGPSLPTEPLTAPVTFEQKKDAEKETSREDEPVIAYRHKARRVLLPGQVVWVRLAKDKEGRTRVAEIALSAVWRHHGKHTSGERIPEHLAPCGKPKGKPEEEPADAPGLELCPTCRVFGSADTAGADSSRAEQHAYRGHLRFSDARPVGQARALSHKLAPLGTPKPGAGQFYLDAPPDRDRVPDPWEPGKDLPLREWGSRLDTRQPRHLRGRKQYWLTGQHERRPYFRAGNTPFDGEMAATGEALAAGTRFTYTVHFENLTTAEIGGLLAALDPSLALPAAEGASVGFAVGGGRPFGFGTCTAEITGLRVQTAADRYGGAAGADQSSDQPPTPALTVADAVTAFRETLDQGVRDTWPHAAAALQLDRVEPGEVWYPTLAEVPAEGKLEPADLEAGFDYWQRSTGYALSKEMYPLLPLPEATDADQRLPLAPESKRRPPQPKSSPRGGPPGRRR